MTIWRKKQVAMLKNNYPTSHGYCCECKYWQQIPSDGTDLCVRFSKESYQHFHKRGQDPFDYCTAFEPIPPVGNTDEEEL